MQRAFDKLALTPAVPPMCVNSSMPTKRKLTWESAIGRERPPFGITFAAAFAARECATHDRAVYELIASRSS
jgi:hypothetical protein